MVINTARSRILRRGGVEAQVNWQASTGTPTLYAYVEGGEMQVPDQGADIVIDFDVGRSFREDYPGGPFTFPMPFRDHDLVITLSRSALPNRLRVDCIVPERSV